MLLVDTSSRHWLRLHFKQLSIQFVRCATLYSYLALYYYYICAICHPILLFGTICLLGTQEPFCYMRKTEQEEHDMSLCVLQRQ